MVRPMQSTDRAEFAKILLGLAEIKGREISKAAAELFWNSMQHWSLQDFRNAANHLVRTAEYMPTPKQFEDLRRAGRPAAAEVWSSVRRYLTYNPRGYTLDPQCPPMIAKCVAAIGGANAIAMCDQDALHFLERQFCQRYEELQDVTGVREALPELTDALRLLK